MSVEFPLHRFQEFGGFDPGELEALQSIGGPPVRYKRHQRVRAEHVTVESFYLLVEGWVAVAQTLANGGRQILKAHLPGDAVGTPSMCMVATVEEVFCLTDATLIEVPLSKFGHMLDKHPRIGARFLLSVQLERVVLMDRLASKGQTAAPAQIAAFLLDLVERLKPVGLLNGATFTMHLTQAHMGDLLGMTGVHVNRTLRAIEQAGLIRRTGQEFTIVDQPRLAKLAGCNTRSLHVDPAWLPPARA